MVFDMDDGSHVLSFSLQNQWDLCGNDILFRISFFFKFNIKRLVNVCCYVIVKEN